MKIDHSYNCDIENPEIPQKNVQLYEIFNAFREGDSVLLTEKSGRILTYTIQTVIMDGHPVQFMLYQKSKDTKHNVYPEIIFQNQTMTKLLTRISSFLPNRLTDCTDYEIIPQEKKSLFAGQEEIPSEGDVIAAACRNK